MSIRILDIWGEGRVYDGDTVSGFDAQTANNLNLKGATISHGPDKGQPVPNLIPVADDSENTVFPLSDNTYQYLTWMNPDIARCSVAAEMCRVLRKDGSGRVFLYTPNELVLSMFTYVAGHYQPRIAGTMKRIGELDAPFNQITRGQNKSDVVWVFQVA